MLCCEYCGSSNESTVGRVNEETICVDCLMADGPMVKRQPKIIWPYIVDSDTHDGVKIVWSAKPSVLPF